MPYIIEDGEFESLEDMQKYYKLKEPWYERAWDFVYLPVYRFFRWIIWENIKPSNFKHWYQRAKQGYSYQDCWSVDWYLADIIPKMVRQLKNNAHGHPGDITEEEWSDVLEDIARAFELEYEIIDYVLYDCADKKQERHMKKLMKDKDSFEGCRIMTTAEKCTRDRGWKYFRKYFYNLWS